MFYNTRNSLEQDEAWAHHDLRGAQDWAHNRPWASLGPSWPKRGPKFEPRIGPGQAWAYRGLWGAQVWAHNGPWASLGPSWPMGGGGNWTHIRPWASLVPSWPMGGEPMCSPGLKNPHQTQNSHKSNKLKCFHGTFLTQKDVPILAPENGGKCFCL
jgi:hypothetical protein